jgi:hypothetical protein
MPSLAEIWRALHGAWKLLFLDTRGLAQFDGSRSGGLRSFWAIALVLPLNVAIIAIDQLGPAQDVLPPHSAVLQLIGLVIAWPALLLVIYILARWYGRAERYWLFVTTYNWTQIPIAIAAMLIIAMLTGVSAFVDLATLPTASGGVALAGWIAVLAAAALKVGLYGYEWYVAFVSLDAGVALPIIVVLLDIVSGLALDKISIWLA